MDDLMRWRPSPSMAVALVALFVALTGTAIGGGKTLRPPPNSVGPKELKPNAVTPPDIAPAAIKPSAIATGAVKPAALAPGAVTTPAIATGAVTTPTLATGAVDPRTVKIGAIGQAALAPNSVGPDQIKTGAVTRGAIVPGAVDSSLIASGAVTSSAIAPDAVTAPAIASGAVVNTKLAPDSVSKTKIQPDAVGSAQIEASAVTAPKIGPQAVTQAKIGGSSVGTTELSNAIPSASAFKSTATTWTNGSYTAFHFPSETFDTANLHGAADYRMKAPVAGIYSATVVATWKNDGCGGTRSLEFDGRRADDTTPFLPSPYISSTVPANAASTTTQTLTGMIQLAAGESLEIWGGAGGMSCGTTETLGNPAASLTMSWIAPGP